MDEPIYPLKNLSDSIVFQFESIGRNGTFLKEVKFNAIKNLPDFYQLVLADIDKDNNRSVLSESRNQDMNKIMATVIECMLIFLEKKPTSNIVFSGSTPIRTRLYKIIITKVYDSIKDRFEIQGFSDINGFEIFNMNHEYSFFVMSIKNLN